LQTGDHVQRRRLARAIGAEQRLQLSRSDIEIEIVDGKLGKTLAQPAYLQCKFDHHAPRQPGFAP
jgi:hypothetical protein